MERGGDTTEIRAGIGAAVRRLRRAKGWTQANLADEAGMSYQAVSKLELGQGSPSLRTLVLLADKLCVPVRDLFPAPPADGDTPALRIANRLDQLAPSELAKVEAVIAAMLD